MAYDDKNQKKMYRHTVRFKRDDDALIAVLAKRLGVQKATLIQNMALQAAELELQRLGADVHPHGLGEAAHRR